MSLRYILDQGKASVLITDTALTTMLKFRQTKSRHKEAGGQLFARFDGPDVVIVEATGPTFLDRRSRYGFEPNRLLQRRQIRQKHAAGLHFVGDWHTHPEVQASPSGNDLASMKDCFQRSGHDLRAFLLIIVGIALPPEGWYVSLITANSVQQLHSVKSEVRQTTELPRLNRSAPMRCRIQTMLASI
jgi:integrative and conjugative element protein (TIGR02256 family)